MIFTVRQKQKSFTTQLIHAIVSGILALTVSLVVSLIAAVPTYFLWNWLMPSLFGVKIVTLWQAWGINFLSGLLFRSSSSSSSQNND